MSRLGWWLAVGAVAAVAALLLACSGSGGAELRVNSSADAAERDGRLTLREALLLASGGMQVGELDGGEAAQVSGTPGRDSADTIVFQQAEGGSRGAALESSLPPLSSGRDIIEGTGDGTDTQRAVIDGGDQSFTCLEVASDGNTVRGLEIANCHTGVIVHEDARENVFGGRGEGEGNVVSGNVVGVELRGRQNRFLGNLIGLDSSGSKARGNEFEGIWVTPAASQNIIGGPGKGEGNVISGNKLFGLSLDSADGNVVQGNFIGLDSSGAQPLGNNYGMTVQAGARDNLIGGDESGQRNVFAANNTGILFRGQGTSGNTVRGNYFGTDTSGEVAIKNVVDISQQSGAAGNVLEGNRMGAGS